MASRENLSFRPAPDGWTFDANPILFGAPHVYLVSDAQRAELVARLRRARWRFLGGEAALFALALGAIMLYAASSHRPDPVALLDAGSPTAWALAGLALAAFVAAVLGILVACHRAAVAPVLARATRIPMPTRLADRIERAALALSPRWRAVLAVALFVLGGFHAYLWLTIRPGVVQLVFAAFWAFAALYHLALLLVAVRAGHRNGAHL